MELPAEWMTSQRLSDGSRDLSAAKYVKARERGERGHRRSRGAYRDLAKRKWNFFGPDQHRRPGRRHRGRPAGRRPDLHRRRLRRCLEVQRRRHDVRVGVAGRLGAEHGRGRDDQRRCALRRHRRGPAGRWFDHLRRRRHLPLAQPGQDLAARRPEGQPRHRPLRHRPEQRATASSPPPAGNLFVPGGERGVYLSENGGDSWNRVLAPPNNTTGATEVVIDPNNPNRVYAAMWDHLREPHQRTYGGPGSSLWRSDDGGRTWQRMTNGLPDRRRPGPLGTGARPGQPQRLYAYVGTAIGPFRAFYRSDDGGDTWTQTPVTASQASQSTFSWWFGKLWVDPERSGPRLPRRGEPDALDQRRAELLLGQRRARRPARDALGPEGARPGLPGQRRRHLPLRRRTG